MHVMRNRPGDQRAGQRANPVLTIGNFDGMHRGHDALISRCRDLAARGSEVAVVTFEPLPQALFWPDSAPARLSTVYQKLQLLRDKGVDRVWLLRFDRAFSRLSARDFAEQVIVRGLAASHVVVGEDFHFGHRREGDVEKLSGFGRQHGFELDIVPAVYQHGARVSSSAIRHFLAQGDFPAAAAMLGRPFSMEGHVVRGQHLGRKLGYPTANLRIRAVPSPVEGIFAVHARTCGQDEHASWMPGVCSLGWRPTVGGREPLLEVHIFEFDGDLYGQRLEVEFVAKLRKESHFATIEQLVEQMRHDEAQARAILARSPQAPAITAH